MVVSAHRSTAPQDALQQLRMEALECRACPLWCDATQTVFGKGPAPVPLMLVTVHPSYLLRIPDADRKEEEYRNFVEDLRLARETVA